MEGEPGRAEGGKAVVGMYYMRKESLFNNNKKVYVSMIISIDRKIDKIHLFSKIKSLNKSATEMHHSLIKSYILNTHIKD